MDDSMKHFIVASFPTAMERGYIQAYYQPVIRTMFRRLCSFEALARWIDPEKGMIGPDQFIPALEEAGVIHQLDACVLGQVCARIRSAIDAGEEPIPVSVNLSRRDFFLCDIFSVVNRYVNQYQVPHNLLYIEITESVMAEQEEKLREVIDRFRSAGFQVWMDDFGSGYSSLNVLKDFTFDELKMDMRFLSSFDHRSRRIMTSVIQMAKEIDLHTLAEGVETEEQFQYLRNIGCEKAQGYLFGRPLPYEQAMQNLRERGIEAERAQDRKYFDDIGMVSLLSAVPFMGREEREALENVRQLNSIPLALAEGKKDSFTILFYNTAFGDTARGTDLTANIFCKELLCKPQPYAILPRRLLTLMDSTRSGGDGRMLFISNEEYYEIQARCVAQNKEAYCVLFRLSNLSQIASAAQTGKLDDSLRQIYTLFDRITLVDLAADAITPLYMATREDLLSGRTGLKTLAKEYADTWIFPDDRADYLALNDWETLENRFREMGDSHVSLSFRTYTLHGQYVWKQYTLLRLQPGIYIELIRDVNKEVIDFIRNQNSLLPTLQGGITPELLWENLVRSGVARIFWKDADRRFLGASRSFLDYYGFASADEIIGKNDEDLGWHIRPDHFMNDELQVIHEGVSTHNEPGRCINHGENREILASKAPLYDGNGKIVGLIGNFVDKGLLTVHDRRGAETALRDQMTGLLNSRGISEEARAFQDEYYLRNADFVRIHLGIDDFSALNRQYGFDFGDKALATLGAALKQAFGRTAAVARYSGHQFVVLQQVKAPEEGNALCARIRAVAADIRSIDGVPITFYLSVGCALYSECQSVPEQARTATLRLLADQSEHSSTESRVARSAEIFHLYDDLPISYSVYQLSCDAQGRVTDATMFYVNHLFERRSGKTAAELLGRGTREMFPTLEESWYDMARRAAIDGETIIEPFYFEPTGKHYYMTASPVIRTGYCCFTYQEVELKDQKQ